MKSRTFPGKWGGHKLSQEREQNLAFDALIPRLISAERRGYIDLGKKRSALEFRGSSAVTFHHNDVLVSSSNCNRSAVSHSHPKG